MNLRFSKNSDVRKAGVAIQRASVVFLMWGSDMAAVRFLAAMSSLMWATILFWPGVRFSGSEFAVMGLLLSEPHWGFLFALHGVLAVLNLIYKLCTYGAYLFEGVLGCSIWSFSTISLLVAFLRNGESHEVLLLAPHISITLCSWWILVRYNINKEPQ